MSLPVRLPRDRDAHQGLCGQDRQVDDMDHRPNPDPDSEPVREMADFGNPPVFPAVKEDTPVVEERSEVTS